MKKLIIVGLMVLLSLTTKIQAQMYEVVDLGTLGGDYSEAFGINDNGKVVGYASIGGYSAHAFLYDGNLMQDIGILLTNNTSYAYKINNKDQVVGYAYVPSGDPFVILTHAFLYTTNTFMRDIDESLGGNDVSDARGINNDGVVVATSNTQRDPWNGMAHAFTYTDIAVTDLSSLGSFSKGYGINDNGQVVGIADITNSHHAHAFLYSNTTMYDLGTLGGNESQAYAINNNTLIVGSSQTSNEVTHAFLYSEGSMKDLGTPDDLYSEAYAINSANQIVGYSENIDRVQIAFLYSDGLMRDLNALIEPNSSWLLQYAYDINNLGQIVGSGVNSNGQYHAFLLNPTWLKKIKTPFTRNPYGTYPGKEAGKDNLILITHGWINPLETADASTAWVNAMSNSISTYLISNNLTNWQVIGYKWTNGASSVQPQQAINNGAMEGGNLGKAIGAEGWTQVHLIAHSAGSALIQACSEMIKTNSWTTTVQCTFLDAFVGLDYAGINTYGKGADWADSYFSRDKSTGGDNFPFTEGSLAHAYNVDVTKLDPTKIVYNSFSSGLLDQCYTTKSSHAWPIDFYTETITGSISESDGLGFPVSEEGGRWGGMLEQYAIGNPVPHVLGTPDPVCNANNTYSTTPAYIGVPINFGDSSTIQSDTGSILKEGLGLQLITGSPVWLSMPVSVSNAINFVSFDAQFLSESEAASLLSVDLDASTIGFIDETNIQTGTRHYTMSFPVVTNGVHMLGFRLDPYSSVPSTLSITNVVVGYVGVNQTPALSVSTNAPSGLRIFQLTAQPGFTYTLQASTNLVNWDPIAILINTNGTVPFIDPDSVNFNHRFYRAVAPF